NHVLDFYHLWTAKHFGCSIFLTTDFSFRRFFENNLATALRDKFAPVRIVKPSELGEELGLVPIPHHLLTPLDCDWFYEMFEPDVIDKQKGIT
ncbi:MAG: hypothetical protein J0H31_00670, partial [Alphaproteobacteria bacterium]|nr:hypothetical protein [Alphaproteobacteria bacterium]